MSASVAAEHLAADSADLDDATQARAAARNTVVLQSGPTTRAPRRRLGRLAMSSAGPTLRADAVAQWPGVIPDPRPDTDLQAVGDEPAPSALRWRLSSLSAPRVPSPPASDPPAALIQRHSDASLPRRDAPARRRVGAGLQPVDREPSSVVSPVDSGAVERTAGAVAERRSRGGLRAVGQESAFSRRDGAGTPVDSGGPADAAGREPGADGAGRRVSAPERSSVPGARERRRAEAVAALRALVGPGVLRTLTEAAPIAAGETLAGAVHGSRVSAEAPVGAGEVLAGAVRSASPDAVPPVVRGGGRAPGLRLVRAGGLAGAVRPAREHAPAELGAERVLPVLDELQSLLPAGGLRRGSTVAVRSSSALLALLSAASRAGSWCAVVGMPALNLAAASEMGIALDRLALVPHPGTEWTTAVAALLDGVDIVVAAPPGRIAPSVAGRLAARARQRGSVLMPAGAWTGADLTVEAKGRWSGLGAGHGRLRARELTIRAQGRGSASMPREVTLWLPAFTGIGQQAETLPIKLRAPEASLSRLHPPTRRSPATHLTPDRPSDAAPKGRGDGESGEAGRLGEICPIGTPPNRAWMGEEQEPPEERRERRSQGRSEGDERGKLRRVG
jgi:hypothetical protein